MYLLCVGTLINRAGTLVVPFMTIYLTSRRGLDVQFATTAIGLSGLGSIIGSALGGHFADQIGRKTVMAMGLFGGAAALLTLSTLEDPLALLTGILLFTAISDMYRPAASAMIADLVEPAARPYAFTLVYLSINVGFAISPVIGGYLANYSFHWLFYGDAATAAFYGVIVLIFLRETLARPSGSEITSAAVGAGRRSANSFMQGIGRVLSDRTFLWFCVANWLLALVYTQAMSTFPLYMSGLGFSPEQYGRVLAVNGVMIVLFQIPLSAFLGARDRGLILTLGAWACGLGFGLKAVAGVEWQFAVTVMIWTLGEMSQVPMMSPIVADRAPAELRARYMGMLNMSFSAGNLLGAPLGGFVLANFGGRFLWVAGATIAALSGMIYIGLRRALRAPGPTIPAAEPVS